MSECEEVSPVLCFAIIRCLLSLLQQKIPGAVSPASLLSPLTSSHALWKSRVDRKTGSGLAQYQVQRRFGTIRA